MIRPCYPRCGYEVPGMILKQACLSLYIYIERESLLSWIDFEVFHLSRYALSQTMLLLLETPVV